MTSTGLFAPPGFVPYPEISDVFAQELERHQRVFQPLLSVPAADIDPAWSGVFHFVLPVEPYDGALGEGSDDYYGPHCGLGWIKFIRHGSRYQFAGDWRYFAIYREYDDEASSFYAEKGDSYTERKRAWVEQRTMDGLDSSFRWAKLGGLPESGNWCTWLQTHDSVARWGRKPGRLMREDEIIDGIQISHPLNENGQRYSLLGSLTGFLYVQHGADKLLLFYDYTSETILIIPDFT